MRNFIDKYDEIAMLRGSSLPFEAQHIPIIKRNTQSRGSSGEIELYYDAFKNDALIEIAETYYKIKDMNNAE